MDLIRLFVDHGADINLGEDTILFSAIEKQDASVVRVLLKLGADCNVERTRHKVGVPCISRLAAYPLSLAVSPCDEGKPREADVVAGLRRGRLH